MGKNVPNLSTFGPSQRELPIKTGKRTKFNQIMTKCGQVRNAEDEAERVFVKHRLKTEATKDVCGEPVIEYFSRYVRGKSEKRILPKEEIVKQKCFARLRYTHN
ncbi:hypothetical protein LXL04_023839 [Taraxacum kok-saghyz]